MGWMKKFFYVFSIIFINSCKDKVKIITKTEIDCFVKIHKRESFLDFKNVFISVRQKGITSTIYILGRYDRNSTVYFVNYNELINKITEIKYSGMEENKIPSYFSEEKINFLINKFRLTKFSFLGVDNQENVFINPFNPNSPAFFLRKNKNVKLETLRKTGDYVQFNEDWYINRFAIKPKMQLNSLGN